MENENGNVMTEELSTETEVVSNEINSEIATNEVNSASEDAVKEPEETSEVKEPEETSEVNQKVITASKTAKRKIYKKEKVFRLDKDEEEYDEEVDLRKQTFLELVASAKSGKILTGVVDGERSTEMGEIAEVSYNGFTILIPAFDFIEPSSEERSRSTYKNIINRRLGAEVEFIVRQVDEKNHIAIGSRLEAMYAKAHDHYGSTRSSEARIKEGDIVEGRVIAVSGVALVVEVFGVDCVIRQDEISWNRLAEVDNDYSVGDIIKVRLLEIKPETVKRNFYVNGALVERNIIRYNVVASVKRAGKNPSDLYYDEFVIGANYLAVVTQVTDKGIFVRMKDKLDALCGLPDKLQVPKVGDKVLVTVNNKKDDTKEIYATFKKIIKHGNR